MSIALIMPGRDTRGLAAELAAQLPDVAVQTWPQIEQPAAVQMAVLWKQPPGALQGLTKLRAVTSYGAGVDSIVEDPSIPAGLPVGRIVDPQLSRQVAGYLLAVVLERVRELPRYRQAQAQRHWAPAPGPASATIGMLGVGEMGGPAAGAFRQLGFPLLSWRRQSTGQPQAGVFRGADGLLEMANACDFLICTLPLTRETRGILDRRLFAAMPAHAVLINVGRGGHLVEADLIEALDAGQIAAAILDVFAEEPLPAEHPFWSHPKVVVTPHVAGLTDPHSAAVLIAESYRRVVAGGLPAHPVSRQRGY